MKPLPEWKIDSLRRQHQEAVERGDKSSMIRKGSCVEDVTEPIFGAPYPPIYVRRRRLLTEEEIAKITGYLTNKLIPTKSSEWKCWTCRDTGRIAPWGGHPTGTPCPACNRDGARRVEMKKPAGMMPDPNEGNPFEPPESSAGQSRRVGEMIRDNWDTQSAISPLMIPTAAFKLAQHISYMRQDDPDWDSNLLNACEGALGYQDQMIAELQRLLFEKISVAPSPPIIIKTPNMESMKAKWAAARLRATSDSIMLSGVTVQQIKRFALLAWRNHGGIDHQHDAVISSLMRAAGLEPNLYPVNQPGGGWK